LLVIQNVFNRNAEQVFEKNRWVNEPNTLSAQF